jgi:hypothetical protein
MPVFASDFVAYEDMKAYLIDEDADLQETNQDLELIDLIGVKNWLVQKLNGTATVYASHMTTYLERAALRSLEGRPCSLSGEAMVGSF